MKWSDHAISPKCSLETIIQPTPTLDKTLATGYSKFVVNIRRSGDFNKWFKELKDRRAVAKIDVRIRRLEQGNPGYVEPVGHGISEMKIDYGPGYRVYYKDIGEEIIILLCGGTKSRQQKDIEKAKEIAGDYKED